MFDKNSLKLWFVFSSGKCVFYCKQERIFNENGYYQIKRVIICTTIHCPKTQCINYGRQNEASVWNGPKNAGFEFGNGLN